MKGKRGGLLRPHARIYALYGRAAYRRAHQMRLLLACMGAQHIDARIDMLRPHHPSLMPPRDMLDHVTHTSAVNSSSPSTSTRLMNE